MKTREKLIEKRRQLLRSWVMYIVICSLLAFINVYQIQSENLWFLWVVAGWGTFQLLSTAFYLIDTKHLSNTKTENE